MLLDVGAACRGKCAETRNSHRSSLPHTHWSSFAVQLYCTMRGGNLVSITSAEENAWLVSQLSSAPYNTAQCKFLHCCMLTLPSPASCCNVVAPHDPSHADWIGLVCLGGDTPCTTGGWKWADAVDPGLVTLGYSNWQSGQPSYLSPSTDVR